MADVLIAPAISEPSLLQPVNMHHTCLTFEGKRKATFLSKSNLSLKELLQEIMIILCLPPRVAHLFLALEQKGLILPLLRHDPGYAPVQYEDNAWPVFFFNGKSRDASSVGYPWCSSGLSGNVVLPRRGQI